MNSLYNRIIPSWLVLIDLALFLTAVFTFTTAKIVYPVHVIFMLLAIGAFYWQGHAFAWRTSFWMVLSTVVVFRASLTGSIQPEELLDIPLFCTILVTVFFISAKRAQTQTQLEHERAALKRALDERDALQEMLIQQAYYDELTKLPNRALLFDRMRYRLAQASRRQESVAILFLDLDRFKQVNDQYGHGTGDQVLVAVAERLKQIIRTEDTGARLGGDEFIVMLGGEGTLMKATEVAERLITELSHPYVTDCGEIVIAASIGIALSRPGYDQVADLLRNADSALYQAKALGKATFAVFDPTEVNSCEHFAIGFSSDRMSLMLAQENSKHF